MDAILLIIGLLLYLVFLSAILWRILSIKKGKIYQTTAPLSTIVEPKVDALAYYVVIFSREAVRQSYILSVLLVEKAIKISKIVIIKIEKRFAKVVNQVRGKGEVSKNRGAVSFFLQEVKDHRDRIKAEIGREYKH